MPFSTGYFKTETRDYILNKVSKESHILDIGAGCGTYSDMLRPLGYENIDGVEAFPKYVEQFQLTSKYNNLYVGDIDKVPIDYSKYDVVIMGDVLEHMSVQSAQRLLDKLHNTLIIVAVPFESPQAAEFDNIFEIHLQADLTLINFYERYPGFYPLCLRFDYGVFVSSPPQEITFEISERAFPDHYQEFIDEQFPQFSTVKY